MTSTAFGPVTHQYNASGIYMVCMYGIDTNGTQCQSCQPINIQLQGGNCFFNSFPDPADPNTYLFNAVPAYPMSTITWDFGDGATATGLTTQHTYVIAGTYTVCMTEVDTSGASCTSCQVVTIHNVPSCSFTYNVSLLNPLTINFQANGANTITWDFGDGTTDTGASVNHTYSVGGVYQVCISTGTPGTANFCTTCNIISVGNVANYCNITFYPDPLNPNTFVFTSTQSSPSSMIAWDFGDNTVGTGQSVTHTYNAAGTYVVCVIERDSAQNLVCQNCVTVQTSGNGAACQASFFATSFGLDAYFIDMSVAQLAPVIYNWDFGDGSTSTAQFPQHTYAAPGLYNVCLSISDGNCSDTFCSPLLIDTNVFNPGNGCNAFYATIQLAPYQVTVVNLSSGLNLNYDWDFGDGSHDSNPYPSHVYAATGSYNLCLTVSDNNGCSSTYCDTLNVDTLGNIYRMANPGFTLNVVSPAQLTGINEVDLSKSFSIYPNPFNTELHVVMINGSVRPSNYRIFSIQGAEISGGKLEGTNGIINTASLSAGAYILEVKMNDGSAGYQRVIKN
jgi:PKD repeat protein